MRNAAGDAAEKYRSKLNFFDCFAPLSNNSNLSDNESKDGVLIGEVTTIVFAGHNSDHGIDGEIEFKNERGEATGKRVYLQLKSGDSHLRLRKGEGKEFFQLKKLRHLDCWLSQGNAVLLVVRSSSGSIRSMNVTDYVERAGTGITQIEFDGMPFTPELVKQVRGKFSVSV